MCIIAVIPPGARLSKRVMRRCADANPDGIGMAVVLGEDFHVRKFMSERRHAWRALQELQAVSDRSSIVLHFRWATHGETSLLNVHPFELGETVVAHNGILSGYGNTKYSDTLHFCHSVLSQLPPAWYRDPEWKQLIETETVGSRLAILAKDRTVTLTGSGWNADESTGVLYSNDGWKRVSWKGKYSAWSEEDTDWPNWRRVAVSNAKVGETIKEIAESAPPSMVSFPNVCEECAENCGLEATYTTSGFWCDGCGVYVFPDEWNMDEPRGGD